MLVFAANRLAAQTSRLTSEYSLENLVHPRGTIIVLILYLPLVPLSQYNFVDVINKEVEELVGVLLHVVVELLLLLAEPGDKLLWRYRANLLFLGGNTVEEIGKA